ncbi:hypothetical protein DNTS_002943 [Danionella cerebrum]|uniref:Uncharacterized protein n=1 Tax=Danionella cerebrum TaxID=2873325 RepID=A0A553P9F9_9TELE|nr:hypothetical protein DNTS_002943 [Danionella translucida]
MARFSASSRRCCRSFTVTSRFFFILSSDGFLGLVLRISGLLNCIINFTLNLNKVSFELLLGVQETCVL